MPAIILAHPNSEVILSKPPDPREQDVREEPQYIPPTAEEWERLEAMNGLSNLMAKYGATRVMRWVRTLAAINGEDV